MIKRKTLLSGFVGFMLPIAAASAFSGPHHAVKHHVIKTDSAREIHWYPGKELDFEDSVRKLKKPAFLYIYITGWDEVAKFNQQVLADTNIINFVDSNFMAYKVDMEYDSPNAIKFMIDKAPAIILFDKNAKEIANLQGFYDAKAFRKFLMQRLK